MNKSQPVYLNLLKIKLPLAGIVSLLHRVTGVVLVLAIPFSIYIFQLSMGDEIEFQQAIQLLNHPLSLFIEVILFAILMFHFFAGIRFLLLDIDFGLAKQAAYVSSLLVIGAAVLTTLVFVIIRVFA